MPEPVTIRPARSGDEAEIANVHLNSWREAYRGLLPQTYLDSLPLTFKRRLNWWRTIIADPAKYALLVAENTAHGIVGFACLGPGRDAGLETVAELYAIYLLEAHKGKGIGFNLLSAGFNQMADRNFKSAYCWVLSGNPTLKFYDRSGARPNGMTKEAEIAGQQVIELGYVWEKLAIGDDG